jgi:hypothetical protein
MFAITVGLVQHVKLAHFLAQSSKPLSDFFLPQQSATRDVPIMSAAAG